MEFYGPDVPAEITVVVFEDDAPFVLFDVDTRTSSGSVTPYDWDGKTAEFVVVDDPDDEAELFSYTIGDGLAVDDDGKMTVQFAAEDLATAGHYHYALRGITDDVPEVVAYGTLAVRKAAPRAS